MDPRPDDAPADAPADGCKSGGSRVPPPPPADGRSKRDRSPADGRSKRDRSPADGRPKRGRSTAGRRSKRGPADESKRVVSPAPPNLPPGCPRNLPPGWHYDPDRSLASVSLADGSKNDLSGGPLSPADGSKADLSAPGLSRHPPSADGFTRGGRRPPPSPVDGSLIAPRRRADGSKWSGTPATLPSPADGSKMSGTLASPRSADGSPSVAFGRWLGYSGIILVLFETPSGFAVLHYDGVKLFRPNSVEKIWTEFMDLRTAQNAVILEEFKFFEDKTGAINSDGVSSELAEMINRSLWPGQKLAVAKKEYKDAIEGNLGIDCLFGDAVLELMWGLKNLIKVLVPDEKLELTNEDREQISFGMNMVLLRHGVVADANLVNSDIIDIASTVYETDHLISARDALLQHYGSKLYTVSDIDCKNWDQLKLATALKLVCYPEEEGLHEELLSETEVKTLKKDAHLYEVKFDKRTCLDMFQKIVWASGIRFQALAAMRSIVNETENGLKLHQESPMAEDAKNGLKLKEEQQ